MSARTPHQRGKLEFAGAINALITEIEREREGVSPSLVTYNAWAANKTEAESQGDGTV
jgi:hypothetical protein